MATKWDKSPLSNLIIQANIIKYLKQSNEALINKIVLQHMTE